jgi:hypothetical protein
MALEPMMPSLDDDENPELRDFRRRFWWTLPLSVTVLALAMFGHRSTFISTDARPWIELALSAPVVLWAGWPFFERWAQSIANRSPNMWTLIGTGVGAAFGYSVVATIAPDLFPESFRQHGRVGVYFEAAAIIVSLTLLGQLLELKARSSTSAAIKTLLRLAPKTARRIAADGTEEDIPLTHVHVGDRLRGAPRRDGASRWCRRRGPFEHRRIDADRRTDPCRENHQRQRHWRHLERQRHTRNACRESGLRHSAVPDRATRGAGAALAGAYAAHGG